MSECDCATDFCGRYHNIDMKLSLKDTYVFGSYVFLHKNYQNSRDMMFLRMFQIFNIITVQWPKKLSLSVNVNKNGYIYVQTLAPFYLQLSIKRIPLAHNIIVGNIM